MPGEAQEPQGPGFLRGEPQTPQRCRERSQPTQCVSGEAGRDQVTKCSIRPVPAPAKGTLTQAGRIQHGPPQPACPRAGLSLGAGAGGRTHLRSCSASPAGRCTRAASPGGAGTPATACPAPPWRTSRRSSPAGSPSEQPPRAPQPRTVGDTWATRGRRGPREPSPEQQQDASRSARYLVP